jgi:serine phosphatase RsbU (regulator of sigma subunit)
MAKISEEFRGKCSYAPALMVSALVDSIPYPLIVRDMAHEIVLANSAAEEYFGRSLLHCKCYEVDGFSSDLCRDCPAREAVRDRKAVQREIYREDQGRHLLVSVYPMTDLDGEICGVIETAQDVTDRHEAMDRIHELLERLRGQNDELTEWRRSFQYELHAAREIQRMLVPTRPVCVARMCFDFLYRPSGEVGGDLYDVVDLSPTRVGVLVSDASGHGVGAALIAVMMRMAFRSPAVNKESPEDVLRQLNHMLVETSPTGNFATAFYFVYDSDTHLMRYASSGHPVPVLVRAGGRQVDELRGGGLVMGTIDDIPVEEHVIRVEPDDKILLYTDGLTEATNAGGEQFGIARLEEVVAANAEARGPDFLRGIVRALDEFVGGAPASDDVTLVVAEHVHGDAEADAWLDEHAGT